jgi:lysylphosphatidylglycerol synthetase-like protein (DUF2156 family)
VDDFAAHRAGIERLLDLADEQLSDKERDSLRIAVERWRREGLTPHESVPRLAPVTGLADRLIEALKAADQGLSEEQVRELEALILERLPVWP